MQARFNLLADILMAYLWGILFSQKQTSFISGITGWDFKVKAEEKKKEEYIQFVIVLFLLQINTFFN